jgi:dethiobiotin synthetase
MTEWTAWPKRAYSPIEWTPKAADASNRLQSPMLAKIPIPALLVLGTDTGVGKTMVAGAIGDWFRRRSRRVSVLKACATGCVRRREGLVSEDAEFLAHHANARFPLDVICPQCFVEPLAPAVAAERTAQPLDWSAIDRSIRAMAAESDVMIVEGVGGLMVPMDARHTFRDVASWLGAPAIVVARPSLGTINHTLLTLSVLREAKVPIIGVVINRYPADSAGAAEESNPRAIEKWGKVPVLCLVPEEKLDGLQLPPGIVAAIDTVDWEQLTRSTAGQGIAD